MRAVNELVYTDFKLVALVVLYIADHSKDVVDFMGRIADSLECVIDHVDPKGLNFMQKVLQPGLEL